MAQLRLLPVQYVLCTSHNIVKCCFVKFSALHELFPFVILHVCTYTCAAQLQYICFASVLTWKAFSVHEVTLQKAFAVHEAKAEGVFCFLSSFWWFEDHLSTNYSNPILVYMLSYCSKCFSEVRQQISIYP